MKIIQFIGRFNVGGTANWLATLIPELEKCGYDLLLFAGSVADGEVEDARFSNLGGRRIQLASRHIDLASDLRAIRIFRRMLKNEKPDILNTHTAKAGMIGRIAAIGLPIKTIHTFHGHLLSGYLSPIQRLLYIQLDKALNLFTDSYISVGKRTKQDLLSVGIGTLNKIVVIYPCVEQRASIEPKVKRNVVTVGWLGRVTHIKRPDLLIRVAQLAPDINFLVGGGGDLLDECSAKTPPNVKWLGWVEASEFWKRCDIALLTSDNEGVPTSLIEAALSGLPIVARDVGGVNEVFNPGEGGVLADTAQELAQALRHLASEPYLRQQMGSSARSVAEERFGLERFINLHKETYGI